MLILLLILNSIISELNIGLIIKAILTSILGVSIALCIVKAKPDKLAKLSKFSDIVIKSIKIVSITMMSITIFINIIGFGLINKQYKIISSNIEMLEDAKIIYATDIVTKKILMNSIEIYDGVSYIYYSIINEEDKIKIVDNKYNMLEKDNSIIELFNTVGDKKVVTKLDIIKYTLSSRKLIKNTGKLFKLQYYTIICFSICFYLIIQKFIFFNKKRKNG